MLLPIHVAWLPDEQTPGVSCNWAEITIKKVAGKVVDGKYILLLVPHVLGYADRVMKILPANTGAVVEHILVV